MRGTLLVRVYGSPCKVEKIWGAGGGGTGLGGEGVYICMSLYTTHAGHIVLHIRFESLMSYISAINEKK